MHSASFDDPLAPKAQDHDAHAELVLAMGRDPVLAHRFLFKHRHTEELTPAHLDMIRAWHSDERLIEIEGFRGFGKSSIAEEAVIIKALYKRFKNGLVISATIDLACEHLGAIATELISNDKIAAIFGEQVGEMWGADKIVLSNGVCIQAISKGQKLRGTKHNDARPDLLYGDDIEDEEDVRTPKARAALRNWFFRKLLPAMTPPGTYTARVLGTDMDPESLLAEMRRANWLGKKYPLIYRDEDGHERSTWEQRFPLEMCLKMRQGYEQRGALREFLIEFQCEVEREEDKAFKREMFRVEPRVRTWQVVYHMWDPARTVSATAATTGFASWSWFGADLVVWKAYGLKVMPDEVVRRMFDEAEADSPVTVAVEEDGLNEWLKQPIRAEMLRRRMSLPLQAVKAPKGKIDFIKGLQPFFMARELVFAQPLPELASQLLSFPTGAIDIPNALAYALRLRPGAPIYEDFGARHVAEDLRPSPGEPCWLCLNATGGMVTGQLVQVLDGAVRVYADWIREGEPSQVLGDIVAAANLETGKAPRLVAGAQHFDRFHNVGLVQAIKALPADVRQGGRPLDGRRLLAQLMQRERHHMPLVMVGQQAKWTLNGLAGGYARVVLKGGMLADYADEGPYKLIMEALEGFVGLMALGASAEGQDTGAYATASDGRRYQSLIRQR